MSVQPNSEAFVRAALHAAADSLEPRSNGLQRIRARVQRPRPLAIRWLVAAWTEISMRTPPGIQDGGYWLASHIRAACVKFDRAITPGRHRSTAGNWARPVAVMAVVMFIVAAGTYAAITASNFVSPSNSGAQSASHSNPPAGHSAPVPDGSATHSFTPSRSKSAAAASCQPTAATTPAVSPASSPTDSATPTDTPSDTSSDTGTPSDTGTSSPDPTDSVSPSPSQNAGPTTAPAGPAASASPCTS